MDKDISTYSICNNISGIFESKNMNINQNNLKANHSVIPTNDINQEKYIENSEIINYKKLKDIFSKDLEKYICKIKIVLSENIYKIGTGFFCQLEKNNIKLLLTNNHIINDNYLESKKGLEIEVDNTITILNMSIPRYKYTNREFDFTLIEIINKDNISNFFSVIEDIGQNNYKNEQIFSLHYPEGKNLMFSFGKIKEMIEYNLYYSLSTLSGSSGCPIILFNNMRVIGIHLGYDKRDYYNQGISIEKIIEESEVIHKAFGNFYSINWEKTSKTFNIPFSSIKNKNYFNVKVIIENDGNLNFTDEVILKSENSEDFNVLEKINNEELNNINKYLEINAKIKIKNFSSIYKYDKTFKISLIIIFSKENIEIRNNKIDINIYFLLDEDFKGIPIKNFEDIKKILENEYNIYLDLNNIMEIVESKKLYEEKLTPNFNYNISQKIWKILNNK